MDCDHSRCRHHLVAGCRALANDGKGPTFMAVDVRVEWSDRTLGITRQGRTLNSGQARRGSETLSILEGTTQPAVVNPVLTEAGTNSRALPNPGRFR